MHQAKQPSVAAVPALHLPALSPSTPQQADSAAATANTHYTVASSGPSSSGRPTAATPSRAQPQHHAHAASIAHAVPLFAQNSTPSALLASHTNAMGVFSAHRSQRAIADALSLAAAQRHIDSVAAAFARASEDTDVMREQFEAEKTVRDGLQREVDAHQYELTHSLGAIKNFLERRTRAYELTQAISASKEKIRAHADVLQRAQGRFESSSLALDRLQAELAELDELRGLLAARKEDEAFHLALLAQASAQHNQRLARRARVLGQKDEQIARAEEEAAAAKDMQDHLKAEEHRRRHAEELRVLADNAARREEQIASLMADAVARRTANIQALKASTTQAHVDMVAANARRAKQLAGREKRREEERKELLAAGKNPDAIFAARDEEKRQEVRVRRVKQAQVVRAEELKNQMASEALAGVKASVVLRKDAAVIAEYKRKMGHSVVDVEAARLEAQRTKKADKRTQEEAMAVRALEDARFVPRDIREADDGDSDDESLNFPPAAAAPAHGSNGIDSSDDDLDGGTAPDALLSPAEQLRAFKSDYRQPGAEYNEWGLRIIPNHSDPYRARLDGKKIARALAAQKAALETGKEMVVCGKVYNTSKFLSDPAEGFVFRDFTVGYDMRQSVTLTNVSFSFNHFKILPIKDEFIDFFEVIYTPVGRMSAGSIAKIEIVFKPKVNKDIFTVLPCLAETGPFSIPLHCLTRKAHVVLSHRGDAHPLDLGSVVLGESGEGWLTVQNKGAVGVDFRVELVQRKRPTEGAQQHAPIDREEEKEQSASPTTNADSSLIRPVTPLNFTGLLPSSSSDALVAGVNALSLSSSSSRAFVPATDTISSPPDFHRSKADEVALSHAHRERLDFQPEEYLSFETRGRVEGYGETKWRLEFAPLVEGEWSQEYRFTFGPESYAPGQREVSWASPKEFRVVTRGSGSLVPVYLDSDVLDFQTCAFGKLYRSEIVLRNRSKVAHKIHMHLPTQVKGMAEFIQFNPDVGYIQALESLKVQVKFLPSHAMWQRVKQMTLDAAQGCISEAQHAIGHVFVPMRVEVTDQVLPVLWNLTARVVEPALKLSQTSLEFGSVYTTESKALSIVFTNQSPLLQKLSFVRLPAEVSVEPHGGMLTIPPFRSMDINVIWSPSKAVEEEEFEVEVRTKLGDTIRIPCRGVGKKPPIKLQYTQVAFQATPNFTASFQANFVSNTSKHWRRTVEFIVDEPVESAAVANSIHSARSFLRVQPRTIQLEPVPAVADAVASKINSPGSPKSKRAVRDQSHARVELEFRPFLTLDELYAKDSPPPPAVEAPADVEEKKQEIVLSQPADDDKGGRKRGEPAKRGTKKKPNAEQEAELARKAAAEEELRRLEEEKAQLAAQQAAELAERLAVEHSEANSREALEARDRVFPRNDRPERNWVEFSDRLQLQIVDAEQAIEQSNERLAQMSRFDEDDEEPFDEDEAPLRIDAFLPPQRKIVVDEPFSRHSRHRVAVHIRSEHVATGEVRVECMFMQVSTTLVLPLLQVKPRFVDFGQVPLGRSCTKSFEVRNTSTTESMQLCHDTLGYSSGFSVVNALRRLQPGEIQILVVEFKPRREGRHFKQDLVLRSVHHPNVQVAVPLLGLCISPNLEIVLPPPANERTQDWPATSESMQMQLLHLGDCVVNDPYTRSFTVKNLSEYPYAYHLSQHDVLDGAGAHERIHGSGETLITSTHNMQPGATVAFHFVPSQGQIPANGECSIECRFTGSTPTLFFPAQTVVEIGNQRLKVQAEVHERQVFIAGGRQIDMSQIGVAAPALQQQLQSSSFQNKSAVAGVTRIHDQLLYQHPLAFLDGADVLAQSVGGGAVALAYPLLLTASPWDRVASDDSAFTTATNARVAAVDSDKRKTVKGKDLKDKKPAAVEGKKESSAAAVSGDAQLASLDPLAVANRCVELTFDTQRVVESSSITQAAGGSTKARSRDRAPPAAADANGSATGAPTQYLVESLHIGSTLLHSVVVEPTGKGALVDAGQFEINLHPATRSSDAVLSSASNNDKSQGRDRRDSNGGGGASSSSGLDADSVVQLFSVSTASGALRAGEKEKVEFCFDLGKYQQMKAADAERRVLSVGQWLEASARVVLRGGFTPAHIAPQQTIDVRLRVYVD